MADKVLLGMPKLLGLPTADIISHQLAKLVQATQSLQVRTDKKLVTFEPEVCKA